MDHKHKVLVMSDTHGDYRILNEVVKAELPFEYLIHCGDAEANPEIILDCLDQYKLVAVRGNCDLWNDLPAWQTVKIGFCNVLAVHGHRHGVNDGTRGLLELARKNHADVVCYGHTHSPSVEQDPSGILLINPGSLTRNRPAPRNGTYAILTVSEDFPPEAILKEWDPLRREVRKIT